MIYINRYGLKELYKKHVKVIRIIDQDTYEIRYEGKFYHVKRWELLNEH